MYWLTNYSANAMWKWICVICSNFLCILGFHILVDFWVDIKSWSPDMSQGCSQGFLPHRGKRQARDSSLRESPLPKQFKGIYWIPIETLSPVSRTLQRSKTKISGKDQDLWQRPRLLNKSKTRSKTKIACKTKLSCKIKITWCSCIPLPGMKIWWQLPSFIVVHSK